LQQKKIEKVQLPLNEARALNKLCFSLMAGSLDTCFKKQKLTELEKIEDILFLKLLMSFWQTKR
jgi:hypothetical protein